MTSRVWATWAPPSCDRFGAPSPRSSTHEPPAGEIRPPSRSRNRTEPKVEIRSDIPPTSAPDEAGQARRGGGGSSVVVTLVDYENSVEYRDVHIVVKTGYAMEYTARITSAESLGRVLAQARALNGWSQRDLAERLGTSQRYVWEIEAGKPSIFTERLFAYIRETGTTLTATIREPDESTTDPTPDESSPDTTTAGERHG